VEFEDRGGIITNNGEKNRQRRREKYKVSFQINGRSANIFIYTFSCELIICLNSLQFLLRLLSKLVSLNLQET
jgi:hypothetical protein